MTQPSNKFVLSAAALAVSVLLAACGGGEAGPPPDAVAPTLAISDPVSGTATGAVTFTFTFSEDVGSSFTAEDIVVTGGTASAFTKVDATHYTLVVTPTENAAGTINVSVAAAKFSDLSSNANTASSAVTQAFDTVPPPTGGGTVLASFDEATPPAVTEFGGAGYAIEVGPTGGSGKALKIARNGGDVFAGAWVAIPAIPNNAGAQTISARVYSPTAGIPFVAKAEYGDNAGTGEVQANQTVVAGWQTLTWTFTNLAAPNVYSRFTVLPNLGTVDTNKNYYIDDITLVGAGAGGGGGGGTGACGTTEPTCAPTTVIPTGATIIYSDAVTQANLDTAPVWGQSPPVVSSEPTIAGNKSLKYTFTAPALYQGIDWSASPVDVSAKTKLHLDFWSANVTSVKVSIISAGKESAVTVPLTAGSWNAADIDLSQYTVQDKTAIIQIKLEPNVGGTLYVDNIHFYGSAGGGSVACGTTEPTCAPATSIPAGSIVVYSDASSLTGLNMAPDWGQGTSITRSSVTIASNVSQKYVFTGAPFLYQGIDWSGTPQNVSGKATVHLDVWTADVASVKISLIGGGSENGITKTLTAGTWNSLDINLSEFTSPDLTQVIQMKLEPSSGGTIYVDNIHFAGTASGGGGGGSSTFEGGIFSSDYSGNLGAGTAKSNKGGNVGFFQDPRLFANKAFEDGSVCGSACNPGGVYNFYYGIGKLLPALTDAYFGGFVNAPGNTTADASAYSKVKLKFWGDAESWEKPNFTAQVDVLLQGPANAACTNPSGRPEITKAVTAQKIGAGSEYVISKTDFVLTESCGGAYSVNTVWSAVGAVVVRLSGTNLQYVNTVNSTPVSYPTFLNIGPISFIN